MLLAQFFCDVIRPSSLPKHLLQVPSEDIGPFMGGKVASILVLDLEHHRS